MDSPDIVYIRNPDTGDLDNVKRMLEVTFANMRKGGAICVLLRNEDDEQNFNNLGTDVIPNIVYDINGDEGFTINHHKMLVYAKQ